MGQFLFKLIAVFSGLLTSAAALGLFVSSDIANFLSITKIPLLILLCASPIITCLSCGGVEYCKRKTISKKQILIGWKHDSQNMR